jgi:hypothetical protein
MESVKKAKQEAIDSVKGEQAIELMATMFDSFAFYYYVQKRALSEQEISMF